LDEELTGKEKRRREREKIRSLGFKAGLEYIWDYYKWRIIILIVVILLVVFELIPWARRMRQTTEIYVALVNQTQTDSAQMDALQAEFEELEGFDADWKETTVFDSAMNVNPSGEDLMTKYYGNASVIRFQSLLHTGTINVLISGQDFVTEQAAQDSFLDLSETLSDSLFSRLSGDGRIVSLEDSGGSSFAAGILMDSGYINTVTSLDDGSVLCVPAVTQDPQVLEDFIVYAVYGPQEVSGRQETETGA
jgi:hypothetical protein